MRKFKLNANLYLYTIPGYGALRQKQIVEGDEYAKYCPSHLTEIFDGIEESQTTKEDEKMQEKTDQAQTVGITLMQESLLQDAIPEIKFEETDEEVKEDAKPKKGRQKKTV